MINKSVYDWITLPLQLRKCEVVYIGVFVQ